MPARASGRLPCSTSPNTAAPRRWPCARAGGPTRSWAGCTPTMPRVLRHSLSAAPAVAVPFLPAPRSRTRRDDPRRPAYGRDAAPDRGRSSAALDAAPPCRLGPRALRAGVLSRDNPNGLARPQAVLEESQKASWTGRPGAKAGVYRARSRPARGSPARPASRGLSRRGTHPSGLRPRLWLGRARPALMGRLKLARALGQALLLRALPLQRRAGPALALIAGQRRAHRRGSSAAPCRMDRSQAPRALGRRALPPGQGRPGGCL